MGVETAFLAASALQVGNQIGGAISANAQGKLQAKQYQLQSRQMEVQKDIISEQYADKRRALHGNAVATAAKNGVKISGSVADSISQSLTQLGIEESYQKYGISAEQNNLAYKSKIAKIQGRQEMINGFVNAGTTALSSYATYDYYWGSGKKGG